MDENPELERAEAELQERLRREKEAERRRPHAKWTDYAIFVAAAVHFINAVVCAGAFLLAPLIRLASGKRFTVLIFFLWLTLLLTAVVSLGIACALSRVLDLTSPLQRLPGAPEEEPDESV